MVSGTACLGPSGGGGVQDSKLWQGRGLATGVDFTGLCYNRAQNLDLW